MVKRLYILLLALVVLTACNRRELYDPENSRYVRVYVNEEILNVTKGFYNSGYEKPEYIEPDIMRVVLYNKASGELVADRYLRNKERDSRGLYFDGHIIANSAEYSMMAYSFGSENTIVKDAEQYDKALAYTNIITTALRGESGSHLEEPVVWMPDHIFVASQDAVNIKESKDVDTLKAADGTYFMAKSLVDSYYLQIYVKGVQWATSISAYLSGMGGSEKMASRVMEADNPVTLSLDMNHTEPVDSVAVLYTTFNTFGKLPDAKNELKITFDIITLDGSMYTATLDISLEFAKKEAIENHWILINKTINIPKPVEAGGFTPSVGDWEDIEIDIVI